MTAEEFHREILPEVSGEEFKKYKDLGLIENPDYTFAEAYHKAKVEGITDEDFTKHFFDKTKVNPSLVDGAIRGYKWLKSQLLK